MNELKMTEQNEQQRQLALKVVEATTPSEREALHIWAGALIELRRADLTANKKAKEAVLITCRAKVIWPILKATYVQIKKHGWDGRSASQKLGMSAAITGLALFGGANAGIAALGGAIGLPLWVVFGAGAMFARHIYEELGGPKMGEPRASYRVVDAEREHD